MSDFVAGRPNRGAWALVHFLALGQQGQEAAATDKLSLLLEDSGPVHLFFQMSAAGPFNAAHPIWAQ